MAKTLPIRSRAFGRRKNNERVTPRTDAWIERLRYHVDARGQRAELARFLSNGATSKENAARVQISKVLDQNQRPNLEFALAADAWMAQSA